MSTVRKTFTVPTEGPLSELPFDDTSLANHIGVRTKTLWYGVLAETENKYTQINIKKKSGKIRLIHAPNGSLKFLQKRLNKNLLNAFQEPLPDYVTAYRPKHDLVMAVKRHIAPCAICDAAEATPPKHNCPRKGAYIQMDLVDFFNRTRRYWVGEMLEKNLGLPNEVAGPIRDIVTVKRIPCPTEKYPEGTRNGVPQGAPTSGAICNLVAYHRLDKPICEFLETLNTRYNLKNERVWVYSRYADDLAFTCGRDFPFTEKVQIVRDLIDVIEHTGYRVNRNKVHVRSSNKNKDLLGLNFNETVTVNRLEYLRLRALVHNCLVCGIETQYSRAGFDYPGHFVSWLKGIVAYVRQVDPRKGTNLYAELHGAIETAVRLGILSGG